MVRRLVKTFIKSGSHERLVHGLRVARGEIVQGGAQMERSGIANMLSRCRINQKGKQD